MRGIEREIKGTKTNEKRKVEGEDKSKGRNIGEG